MPGLLVLANLIASVAGGRVVSAGKGLTGLRLLGSGSLMALLVGSVISLVILAVVRRSRSASGLVVVSAASVLVSGMLLLIYRWGSGRVASAPGAPVLQGAVAVVFFTLLALRCGLWFAGRSLRTGLVAAANPGWTGLAEAAYFGGLMMGLIIGLPAWVGGDPASSAFILDTVLLSGVTLIDRSGGRRRNERTTPAAPVRLSLRFAGLTAAYAAATSGCQIVVFHLADYVARLPDPAARIWADPILASFYLGVALLASTGRTLRPALGTTDGGHAYLQWQHLGAPRAVRLVAIMALIGLLTIGGTLLTWTALSRGLSGPPVWFGLVSIALGAAAFELMILGVLQQLTYAGSSGVALALGLAGAVATVAMLLMLLAGPGILVRATATLVGLALAFLLLGRWVTPS